MSGAGGTIRVESLTIPEVKRISLKAHHDDRGFFVETFVQEIFEAHGLVAHWAQDNEAFSHSIATVRGLHFQRPPMAQAKLVRVVSGAILDVCVDLRADSSSFGDHVAVELSANRPEALFVPIGFAHGYCTLAADTLVQYKCSARYAPETEGAIRWNDPALAIDWPLAGRPAILSPKDRSAPMLSDVTPL